MALEDPVAPPAEHPGEDLEERHPHRDEREQDQAELHDPAQGPVGQHARHEGFPALQERVGRVVQRQVHSLARGKAERWVDEAARAVHVARDGQQLLHHPRVQRRPAHEQRGRRHEGGLYPGQVRLEVEQPLGETHRGEVAEVPGEGHVAREAEQPHVRPAQQRGHVDVAVRGDEEGRVDGALLEAPARFHRRQAEDGVAAGGQAQLGEQRPRGGLGAAARRPDRDAPPRQRREAVGHRSPAIEDPERLPVQRGHAAQAALRIRDELVGPALDEGHVGLAAEQALQVLERARARL